MAVRNTVLVKPIGPHGKGPEKSMGISAVPGISGLIASPQVPNFDRLIHEHIRLGIVSALAANASLTFSDLKRLLQTTDGNLSVHARKLEEAKYIVCTKSFEGRMPRTEYVLTASGRKAFEKYLDHMEALVGAMRGIEAETK